MDVAVNVTVGTNTTRVHDGEEEGSHLFCAWTTMLTETKYLPAGDPTLPGFAIQVTRLVDSYMIWVGVCGDPGEVEKAPLRGNLCRDWACAMPPVSQLVYT